MCTENKIKTLGYKIVCSNKNWMVCNKGNETIRACRMDGSIINLTVRSKESGHELIEVSLNEIDNTIIIENVSTGDKCCTLLFDNGNIDTCIKVIYDCEYTIYFYKDKLVFLHRDTGVVHEFKIKLQHEDINTVERFGKDKFVLIGLRYWDIDQSMTFIYIDLNSDLVKEHRYYGMTLVGEGLVSSSDGELLDLETGNKYSKGNWWDVTIGLETFIAINTEKGTIYKNKSMNCIANSSLGNNLKLKLYSQ